MSLPLVSRRAHLSAVIPIVAVALNGCAFGPAAARSPLREKLATPDTPQIERATITCLEQNGWSVDPATTEPDGTRVIGASWGSLFTGVGVAVNNKGQVGPSYRVDLEGERTHLSIHPRGVTPRVVDAMHDHRLGEFWSCMTRALDAPEPSDGGTEDPSVIRAEPTAHE
jgi:hypothetical protein